MTDANSDGSATLESDETWDIEPEWRSWIARVLALGQAPAAIADRLELLGVPRRRAASYVEQESARTATCPSDGAEGRTLDHLARVYHDSNPTIVPEIAAQAGFEDEFFENYYRNNVPVIIRGFARGAVPESWDLEFLFSRYADVTVAVQAGRRPGSTMDAFRVGRQRRVTLGQFLKDIESDGGASYLTGNDNAFRESRLGELINNLNFPWALLDDERTRTSAHLWVGGAGAVSPLHRDRVNVLNLQVSGEKRFLLGHPAYLQRVYAMRGLFSLVDADSPDLDEFPLFANVRLAEARLQSTDALFIPVAWWHQVRSLTSSMNVSFTNFRRPNSEVVL